MRASMSILGANWKEVVLRRDWWWIAAPLAAIFFGWLVGPITGTLAALALSCAGLGLRAVITWSGVEDKPLSFLLPGYRESVRALYFPTAVLIGLGTALFLLALTCPDEAPLCPPGSSWSELSLNLLTGFLIGIALTLVWETTCLTMVFPLGALVVLVEGVAGRSVFVRWGVLLPVSFIVCIRFWFRLGDMRRIGSNRRLVFQPVVWPLAAEETEPGALSREEVFFLRRMGQYQAFSLGRTCWGGLYQGLAPWLCGATGLIAFVVLSLLAARMLGTWWLILFGLIMTWDVDLPLLPHPAPWLPAGRKERCVATGVTAAAVFLLCVAYGLLVIVSSRFLWLLISAVLGARLGGKVLAPIDPWCFYWVGLSVPWVTALRLCLPNAPRIARGGGALMTLLFMEALIFLEYAVPAWNIHLVCVGALWAGWLLLPAVLWANCRTPGFRRAGACAAG
jgi:hypothetical protein